MNTSSKRRRTHRRATRPVWPGGIGATHRHLPGYCLERLESRWLLSAPVQPADFLLSTATTGNQMNPTVAMGPTGAFVATWSTPGAGGSADDIAARLFDANGTPLTGEIGVNTTTAYRQAMPVVAMDGAGNFVIAWASQISTGEFEMRAQRFDSAGARVGGEILVGAPTADPQGYDLMPAIGMNAAGVFTIAWQVRDSGGTQDVHARRFDAAGAAQGAEFQVNTTTPSWQYSPAVAVDAAGNTVVVFQNAWPWPDQISAQLYDSTGAPVGGQFNVTSGSEKFRPNVAADPSGNFTVVYMDHYPGDGSDWGIFGQRVSAGGTLLGGPFLVNQVTAGDQSMPSIAMTSDGHFAVAWHTNNSDGSGYGINARTYLASASPMENEFLVNTTTAGYQIYPSIATNATGSHYAIVWFGPGSSGQDVFGRSYTWLSGAPTTSGFAPVVVDEDAGNTEVDLWAAFADPNDPDPTLTYSLQSNSNAALFDSVTVDPVTGKLILIYKADANGASALVIRATDPGGLWVEATLSVTVNPVNDPPRIDLIVVNPAQINENESTSVSGTIVDPDAGDGFTLLIDWRDGRTDTLYLDQANPAFSVNHQYLDDNLDPADKYIIQLQVNDVAGTGESQSVACVVCNVAPVVGHPLSAPSAVRQQPVTFDGSFTDAGSLDTHVVSWNFGDGSVIAAHPSTDPGATSPVHAFSASGTYTVIYTVKDKDGAVTTVSQPIVISPTLVVNNVLYVGGTPGNDYINISPCRGTAVFFAAGQLYASFTGITKVVVYGGAGDDTLDVSQDYPRETELWGGLGHDLLRGGLANDALFGEEGNDRMEGRGGHDILVGGPGNDRLRGCDGRDLLLGGAGFDSLYGDADDDIIIAGPTAHDSSLAALNTIRNEWISTRPYAVRIDNIRDGTGSADRVNGNWFFKGGTTVFDDATEDWLCGVSGYDWFFASVPTGDKLMDRISAEEVDAAFM